MLTRANLNSHPGLKNIRQMVTVILIILHYIIYIYLCEANYSSLFLSYIIH